MVMPRFTTALSSIAVWTSPGQMALMRTLSCAKSSAMALVIWITAALLVQ